MEEKQYDLFMEMAANPDFTLLDFKNLGLTADNTQLLDEEVYSQSKKVQENPMFLDLNGNFDKEKLHNFYNNMRQGYQIFAADQYSLDLVALTLYDSNNMFVALSKKTSQVPTYFKAPNPLKQSTGFVGVGVQGPQYLTEDEIAQGNKVLANPMAATRPDGSIDESIAIWHDAPEDSFFTDFWDTRVMAQWDSDGEHIDPITGTKVKHLKGLLKYNYLGQPYYENLDGRDVYGRRVLNKLNTLTKEGSEWNKYDFFDADDLELKAFGGVLMRNLAIVGSMFLPYGIGATIASISAAAQIAGMGAVLGKMLTGSDSPTLSAVEGWATSWNRLYGKSQYAQEHTWCVENFVDTFSDLVAQLREQRVIFELVPAIAKGKLIRGEKDIQALEQELLTKNSEYMLSPSSIFGLKLRKMYATEDAELLALALKADWIPFAKLKTGREVENFMSSYNKIGSALSKSYMAGLISSLLYGEAKMNGLTDESAALVTGGRFLAEMALLNTPLGEFIFPELRYDNIRYKKIMDAFYKNVKETESKVLNTTATKANWAKRLFTSAYNVGADAQAEAQLMGGNMLKTAFTMGTEAGIVNDIEELLNDLAKASYNTAQWLSSDEDVKIFGENAKWKNFENSFDRYAMGMASGLVGGGITSAAGLFKLFKSLNELNFEKPNAINQLLVYMYRNGEIGKFLKYVDKHTIGDKNISSIPEFNQATGVSYKTATDPSMTWDATLKKLMHMQVDAMGEVINANLGNLSDNDFIDIQTLKDLRMQMLANSPIAGRWLQEYNSLVTKLYSLNEQLNIPKTKELVIDSREAEANKDAKKADDKSKIISDIELTKKQIEDLVSGKRSGEFLRQATFSMTTAINNLVSPEIKSLAGYVASKYGRPINSFTQAELDDASNKWEEFKKSNYAADLDIYLADAYHAGAVAISPILLQHLETYKLLADNKALMLAFSKINIALNVLNNLSNPDINMLEATLDLLVNGIQKSILLDNLVEYLDENLKEEYTRLFNNYHNADPENLKLAKEEFNNFIDNYIIKNLNDILKPIIETPYLPGVLKEQLISLIDDWPRNYWLALVDQLEFTEERYLPGQVDLIKKALKDNINKDPEFLLRTVNGANEILTYLSDPTSGDILTHLGLSEDIITDTLSDDLLYPLLYYIEGYDANGNKTNGGFVEIQNLFNQVKESIKSKTNTPIEDYVRKTVVSLTGDSTLGQVVDLLSQQWRNNIANIEDLTMPIELREKMHNGEFINMLDEVRRVLALAKANIIGARTDLKSLLDPFGGYNAAVNYYNRNTEDYQPLAEIQGEVADAMLMDINTMYNNIVFFQRLFQANESLKLQQYSKVLSNKHYIFYNRLNQFFEENDLDGTEDIKAAFHAATLHAEYAEPGKKGRFSLSREDRLKLDEEHLAITDAIYKWALNHKDNIKNVNWLTDNIVSKFKLYEPEYGILDLNTKALTNVTALYELIAHMHLDERAFKKLMIPIYKDTTSGKIPIATQEGAVYLNIALATNRNAFTNLRNAINKNIKDLWLAMDESLRKQTLPGYDETLYKDAAAPYVLNLLQSLTWDNIALVEGSAGAGKTNAVSYYTRKALEAIDETIPEAKNKILRKAYYAHTTAANAKAYAESLGMTKDNKNNYWYGSHNELMLKLFSNMIFTEIDQDGFVKVGDRWKIDDNGRISAKETRINLEASELPSVIFIDEISHMNTLQVDALSRLGIPIFVSGDFKQSGITGEHQISNLGNYLLGKTIPNMLPLHPDLFIHGMKLGISMRTANDAKNNSMNSFAVNSISSVPTAVTLHYYEDANTIKGDKLYSIPTTASGRNYTPEQLTNILKDIRKMVELSKELDRKAELEAQQSGKAKDTKYEKIGYIFLEANSGLYKALKERAELADIRDYIEFYPGSSAQGNEAGYFIVELKDSGLESFDKDLYTGITRSSEASIVIALNSRTSLVRDAQGNKSNINEIRSYRLPEVKSDIYSLLSLERYRQDYLVAANKLTENLTAHNITVENNIALSNTNATLGIGNGNLVLKNVVADYNAKYFTYRFDPIKVSQEWIDKYCPTLDPNKNIIGFNQVRNQNDTAGEIKVLYEDGTTEVVTSDKIGEITGDAFKVPQILQISTEAILENEDKLDKLYTDSDTPPLSLKEIVEESIPGIFDVENMPAITNNDPTKINDVLYTFNTFNLGAKFENDKWVYYDDLINGLPTGRNTVRIDGVNGLRLLDNLTKTNSNVFTSKNKFRDWDINVLTAESIIANLWRHGISDPDKDTIKNAVSNILGLVKSKLYITFAIKNTANVSEKEHFSLNPNSAINNGKPSPYNKMDMEVGETIVHNPSGEFEEKVIKNTIKDQQQREQLIEALESNKAPRRRLVMIIGTDLGDLNNHDYKDVMEVNLATLESPITIILKLDASGLYIFPDIVNTFNQAFSNATEAKIYRGLEAVLQKYDNTTYPLYKNLMNRIKIWLHTLNDVWFNHNSDWTPANNLINYGPQFSNKKGIHLLNGKLQYERAPMIDFASNSIYWMTLELLMADPRYTNISTSLPLYAHNTGVLGTVNGQQITIQKGHPFVFLSNLSQEALNYWSNAKPGKMITLPQYYFKLLSGLLKPNAPKIAIGYVLPPSESVLDYILNLHALITGSSDNTLIPSKTLGLKIDVFRIWQTLINNTEFMNEFNADGSNYGPLIHNSLKKLITDTIAAASLAEQNAIKDGTSTWDAINEVLNKTVDWNDERGHAASTKPRTIFLNLLGALHELVYPMWAIKDAEFTNKYNNIWLNHIAKATKDIRIYYRLPIAKSNSNNDFMLLNSGKPTIMDMWGKSKPISIFGKFDTSVLRGDMNDWYQTIVDEIEAKKVNSKNMGNDGWHYVNEHSNIENELPKVPDNLFIHLNNSNSRFAELFNLLSEDIKTNLLNALTNSLYNTTLENQADIITKLSNYNIIAVPSLDGTKLLLADTRQYNLNYQFTSIDKSDNEHLFKLQTSNGDIYTVDFDSKDPSKLILTQLILLLEVLSPITTIFSTGEYTPEDVNKAIALHNLLSKTALTIQFGLLNRFLEKFREQDANLDKNGAKATFKLMLAKLVKDLPTLLQRLSNKAPKTKNESDDPVFNMYKSIKDYKTPLKEQKPDMCPVTISISLS